MATKYESFTKLRKSKRIRIFVQLSHFVVISLLFIVVFRVARAEADQSIIPGVDLVSKGLFTRAFEWIGNIWNWLIKWFQSIGIDILGILRKLGDLIVLIFESLAKLARWVFGKF